MDLRHQLQRTLGDGYTLEKELEGGGMARVFVARDQQLGRRVVVKTLADDSGVSVSAERFRREIRLAASLQQANIVPVHSAGDVDGVPYYTMPFVEGESLRAHMDIHGALDARVAVNILRDVARALAYAHERGVVHRDIKPENILLSGSTAVVTDFGIAKAIEASHSQAGQTTLTQLGTLLGTPAYISPEQAAGDPNIDYLADIYSLGVVAYEMLAGARPFTATAARALLAAHVNEIPPPLSSKREGLPPRLSSLVMRCLEKEPERRPQKAAELLEALDSAMVAGAATATKTPSIAVLPFANLSPDPADGFFADGLTDEIITDLAGIRSLRVIARSAMMRYRGSDKEPEAVARELRVRYVLDGSVRRAGPSLRLTARLLDTETDATVWSDKLSGGVEDVFAMQERVSRTIVDALRITLSPREEKRLAARPIEDLKAYEAYLQARQAMWTFAPESLTRAQNLLETARARIGDDPRLIAALGVVHLNFVESARVEPAPHLAAISALTDRLAAIDPDSFSRHALLGAMQWRRGHIRESIASLSRALELEPSSADVAVYLCYALLLAGQDAKAREVAELAVALDPLTPLFQCMPGFCEIMAGRADAAVPYYRGFFEADPHNPISQYFYLVALAEAEDLPRATEAAARLAREASETVFGAIAGLYVKVMRGELSADSVVVSPEMQSHAANSDAFARPMSVLLAQMGVVEAAIDALECSVRIGLCHYPYLARNSRVFAALRQHPRFRSLLDVVRGRWERGGTSAADLAAEPAKALAAQPAAKPVIAVLPLTNMSASADDEYFADGMTEDIIAQLSQIASLKVISRTSVMGYKKSAKRVKEIAAELGASHLVEGSVRRAANRLRIVAKLIDSASDGQLWSSTFDRDLTDVFAVQSEVSLAIAEALQATLTPRERAKLLTSPTVNTEAYDAYLLGMHHWYKFTVEGVTKAGEFFKRALAIDENFAPAHAGLANYHLMVGGAPLNLVPASVAIPAARRSAERALELNPLSGPAWEALALVQCWFEHDLPAGRTSAARGAEAEPNSALTLTALAHALDLSGDAEAATRTMRRAVELDPLSGLILAVAVQVHVHGRKFEEADAYRRRLFELHPAMPLAMLTAAELDLSCGRDAAALRLVEPNLDILRSFDFGAAISGLALARAGRVDHARKLAADLEAQCREGRAAWADVALIHLGLGEIDRALDYVELVPGQRPAGGLLNAYLGVSILFDPIRKHPRFQEVLLKLHRAPRLTNASPQRKSVAVLPFANLSPDPENEFFADGITDDLIAQVAKIGSLRVIARTSVMRYRGVQDAARTAAKELGVSAVVEGTVRRAGKRARIVAQLIDPSADAPIWSETYDRDLHDIFAVQSDVAINIAGALNATLSPDEQAVIRLKPTADAAAYDLYLLGRHHWNRRTDESIRKAIDCFEQAIGRDPKYAAAHAGLADAYVFAGIGYAAIPPAEAFAKAKSAAASAVRLDEASPEAQCSAGLAALWCDWDIPRATEAFERSVSLRPNHAPGHQWLGWCRFPVGDYIGSLKSLERALELDPLNASLTAESGWPFTYVALHDHALRRYKRALEIDPAFGLGHYNVGLSHNGNGNFMEAVREYEIALGRIGRVSWVLADLAGTYVSLGERSRAEALLDELVEQAKAESGSWLSVALAADRLGMTERALDALDLGYTSHTPMLFALGMSEYFPFSNARKEPRFTALMKKLGIEPHDIPRQRELLLAHARA